MNSQPAPTAFVPTPEQERALTEPAPLLVLAGPGTGKTTVLTRRIARAILDLGAEPASILALTFTDKAASEMAERLADVLGDAGRAEAAHELTVGTFHSFGGSIIRERLIDLQFDRDPTVLTTPGSWQLLAGCFDELTFDAIELPSDIGTHFGHLLNLFSACKDSLVGPDDLAAYAERLAAQPAPDVVAEYLHGRADQLREATAAYRLYEREKMKSGRIDFGDLLLLPVQLMRAHPAAREAIQWRYPLVFVDEYQDTNYAQRELLMLLLDPDRPNIVVIGDDDQSIYGWRGALVENILRFGQEPAFERHGVTPLTLTLNRRSFPPILDLANRVIAGVESRHGKRIQYHPKNEGGVATIGRHVAATDGDEGEWIAGQIERLLPETSEYTGRKRGYGAFAVLCRKRSLFAPICQALDRRGIPYELLGGTGFFGRWEIKDILSYLMLLAKPDDDVALARILRSRRWRLSSRDLFHLGQWAARQRRSEQTDEGEAPTSTRLLQGVLKVGEVPGLSPDARERLASLERELRQYDALRKALPLGELVKRVIADTGYRRELSALPGFDARAALMNLDKLEQMATEFGGTDAVSLSDFVEYVRCSMESRDDESEVRPVDEETDTVKVMTVHAAKGLEFPVVFVPGLAERVFPLGSRDESDAWHTLPPALRGDRDQTAEPDLASARSKKELDAAKNDRKAREQARQLDEERRLFYVAITRAERHLYLSRACYYGTTVKARAGSEFWQVVQGSGLTTDMGEEPTPSENPNLVPTARPTAKTSEPGQIGDPAVALLPGGDVAAWIRTAVPATERERWATLRADVDEHIRSLGEGSDQPSEQQLPVISCSGLIAYLACPRRYRMLYVDRMPVRPSWRASLGDEVHARIAELEGGAACMPDDGQAPRDDVDSDAGEKEPVEPADPFEAEDTSTAHNVDSLVGRYQASRFGRRSATYVEWPFELTLRAGTLRGRVDRLDAVTVEGSDRVRWELVDFKSGSYPADAQLHYRRQLALYALAVRRHMLASAAEITGHLLLLRDGREAREQFDDASLAAAEAQAEAALTAIAHADYPEASDRSACLLCDYGHLCGLR